MGRNSGVIQAEPQAVPVARIEKRAAFAPKKVYLYQPKAPTGAPALIVAVPKTEKSAKKN
jgi:hypothetical protein